MRWLIPLLLVLCGCGATRVNPGAKFSLVFASRPELQEIARGLGMPQPNPGQYYAGISTSDSVYVIAPATPETKDLAAKLLHEFVHQIENRSTAAGYTAAQVLKDFESPAFDLGTHQHKEWR